MKKFFMSAAVAVLTGVTLCGCSIKRSYKSSDAKNPSAAEITTAGESIPETTEAPSVSATENKPAERVVEPAEGTYIYDKAKLFDSETFKACNDYAEWLYENYLLNTAVVTVNDLSDKTPEEYVLEVFDEIYEGRGSGLILLINNATNRDLLLRTGGCKTAITDDDEKDAFYWSTRDIVSGDYKTAVLRLLQLGEKCPKHIFDNGGLLEAKRVTVLEEVLSECKNDISVILTTNSTGKPNEEILKSYYKRRCGDGKGYMLMIDSKSKTMTAYSEAALPDKFGTIQKKANELIAAGRYEEAVLLAVPVLKG